MAIAAGSLQFHVMETLENLSPIPEDIADIQVENGENLYLIHAVFPIFCHWFVKMILMPLQLHYKVKAAFLSFGESAYLVRLRARYN